MKHFIPLSPDPFLRKDGDAALAKFGHLNAIVDELNQFHLNQTITAFSGGGQASAVALITGINIVDTAVDGDSVILPCIGTCTLSNCSCCTTTDVAAETTAPVVIINNGPGALTIYPCPGVAIDGQAINVPIILVAGGSISITRVSCSDWVSYGLGNSLPVLPCIEPSPVQTPTLVGVEVIKGTGAPLDCLSVCIDNVTITQNAEGCLQVNPSAPAGAIGFAEYVQHTQAPNNSIPPGQAIEYLTDNPAGVFDTIGAITATGPGAIGTAFQLPLGVYMIDYENSAAAASSFAIYTGASNTVLTIDTNTIAGSSTGTTWIHGRAIFNSTLGTPWFMISSVVGTADIPTAGTAAGEFIARLTILKIA